MAKKTDEYTKVKLTLLEPMLGTAPGNPDIYRDFILAGAVKAEVEAEDELESLPEDMESEIQKNSTFFHRLPKDPNVPIFYDYQIKGFFKGACSMLRRVPSTHSKGLKAHKKVIDGIIMVFPRRIVLELPEGGEVTMNERPMRAMTALGERVCLARSEQVPEGTTLEFTVRCLNPEHYDYVEEWLEYGKLSGLGQWRNSGMGRFEYVVVDA